MDRNDDSLHYTDNFPYDTFEDALRIKLLSHSLEAREILGRDVSNGWSPRGTSDGKLCRHSHQTPSSSPTVSAHRECSLSNAVGMGTRQ